MEALARVEKTSTPQLVVTPFMPFLQFREGQQNDDLGDFRNAAREKSAYLLIALAETATDAATYSTSVLITPQGEIAGKYRKSHRMADDPQTGLGNELPVFATPFGRIGVMITTDFYFPEIAEVLRMKGAEILVWQHFPERLREHFQWLPLLNARATDSHAFLVTAHYADPRTYISQNYDYGMQGAAFGRSMIIDRSGTIRTDTGYRDGIATLRFDLDERKKDVYPMTPNFENLFYVPNNGGRAAFAPIAAKWEPPALPVFRKRQARIAVAYCAGEKMWVDGAYPAEIIRLLAKAAAAKPDLILFSENNIRKPESPNVQKGLRDIARWAADHRCYVVVGGLGDNEFRSGAARAWDRTGRQIYAEPLYWTEGAPELKTFDTDFARVATHTCGDLYTFPIDRVLALKGAELILDPSMMWGPSGQHNELMLRARAIDNGCYVACAHWNSSDTGRRSIVVDPYGTVLASSRFMEDDVLYVDIDFSVERVYYAGKKEQQPKPAAEDIGSYFTSDLPNQLRGWRPMMLAQRRPELYSIIPLENEITRRYISKQLQRAWQTKHPAGEAKGR
jgi:predicted amidohydrolase